MASRWELCRAAVSAAVVALTPETDAGVTYHEAQTDSVLDGVSARRAFWQEPPQASLMTEQSSDTVTIRYTWSIVLILKPASAGKPSFANSLATEPLNIARAIMVMAPTTGSQPVIVQSWSVSPGESDGETLVQIQLLTEIQEIL